MANDLVPAGGSSPTLPQSSALAEASPESLTELLSRDPEGYSRVDRDRLVDLFRAQRVKFEAAEAAGKRAPALPKGEGTGAPKKTAAQLLAQTPKSAEDLGL